MHSKQRAQIGAKEKGHRHGIVCVNYVIMLFIIARLMRSISKRVVKKPYVECICNGSLIHVNWESCKNDWQHFVGSSDQIRTNIFSLWNSELLNFNSNHHRNLRAPNAVAISIEKWDQIRSL